MPTIAERIDEFQRACVVYGEAKAVLQTVEDAGYFRLLQHTQDTVALAAIHMSITKRNLEEMAIPSEPIAEVGTLAESTGE